MIADELTIERHERVSMVCAARQRITLTSRAPPLLPSSWLLGQQRQQMRQWSLHLHYVVIETPLGQIWPLVSRYAAIG